MIYKSRYKIQLTLVEHAIEPGKKLLSAVVGVENDGDAVNGSNGADKVGGSDGTSDGSLALLGGIGDALSGEEGSTTLGSLEDDGRLRVLGSLESSDADMGRRAYKSAPVYDNSSTRGQNSQDLHRGAGSDVDGGDGEALGPGIVEELSNGAKLAFPKHPGSFG